MKLFGLNITRKNIIIPSNVTILGNEYPISSSITGPEIENIIRDTDRKIYDIDKSSDEITGTDYRVFTIQDWVYAMRSADQPWTKNYQSSWVQLFDIFTNMVEDPQVVAAINTLKESIQGKDFYISDKEGNRNNSVTELFRSEWYYSFLESIVDIRLWGFGLIQLGDFNGINLTIRDINRKHVRPDLGGVTRQQYDNYILHDWNKEPFKTWTIYQFDKKLGALNPCVRWWIYKNEIARIWAKYNQLMGIPPIVFKTALKDPVRKQNAIDMLKNWLKTRWTLTDSADEIIQMEESTNSQSFFENLIRLADEQISKALLGSTMVLDSGSSRSQSETHEYNTLRIIKSILRVAKFVTDKELIPRLIKIGMDIPVGSRLIWDNSEKLTMKERAEVINIVSMHYKVSTDTASEFIGLDIEEKEEIELNNNSPIKKAITDYKNRLNGKK